MERTDATNEWILSNLAEAHESHCFVVTETTIKWRATCSGCQSGFSISVGGGLTEIVGAPSWGCPASYTKNSKTLVTNWVPLTTNFAEKINLHQHAYNVPQWNPYVPTWADDVTKTMADGIVEEMAKDIDTQILNGLKIHAKNFKAPLTTHDYVETHVKFDEIADWWSAESKKLVKKITLNKVEIAADAKEFKYWVAKSKQAKTAMATPLKAILAELTAGLLPEKGEISYE